MTVQELIKKERPKEIGYRIFMSIGLYGSLIFLALGIYHTISIFITIMGTALLFGFTICVYMDYKKWVNQTAQEIARKVDEKIKNIDEVIETIHKTLTKEEYDILLYALQARYYQTYKMLIDKNKERLI